MTLTTCHVTLLKKLHNFVTALREVQPCGARSRHYGHFQVRFELSFVGPENLSQIPLYSVTGCRRPYCFADAEPDPRRTLISSFYEKEKLSDRVPLAFPVQFPELSGPQYSFPFWKLLITVHFRPVAKLLILRTNLMSSLSPPPVDNLPSGFGAHSLAEPVFPLPLDY